MPFNPDILPSSFDPDVLPEEFNPDQDPRSIAAQKEPRIPTANTPEQAGINVRDMINKTLPDKSEEQTPNLADRLVSGIEKTVNAPVRRAINNIRNNEITGAIFNTIVNPTPSKSFALDSWAKAVRATKDNPPQAALDFASTILESAFAIPSIPFAISGDAAGRFVGIVGRLIGIDEKTNEENKRIAQNVGSLEPLFSLPEEGIAIGAGLLQHTLGDSLDKVADAIPGVTPDQAAIKTLLKYRLSPEQSKQLNSILGGATIVAVGGMIGKGEDVIQGKDTKLSKSEDVKVSNNNTKLPELKSTKDAEEFAKKGITEDQKNEMLSKWKDNRDKMSSSSNFDEKIKLATENQFYRESLESAGYEFNQETGTIKTSSKEISLASTLPGLPEVSEKLGKVATGLHNATEYFKGKIDRADNNLDISSSSNAVDNKAKELGVQLGREVEVISAQKKPVEVKLNSGVVIPKDKINQYRLMASSLIHLAGEDKDRWARFKDDILASPNPKKWMPILDYAFEHKDDPDLVRAAKKMTDIFNSRVMREIDNGVDVDYAGSYYLPGNYPYEDLFGIKPSVFTPGARGSSSSFRKSKVFTDPIEAIKYGFNPILEADKLIQKRVTAGEWAVQNNLFVDKFAKVVTGDGEPIIIKVEYTSKDGEITGSPVPKGYTRINIGPKPFDIHNDYSDLFRALTGSSWLQEHTLGRLALKSEAKIKRGVLFVDMMHASRGIIMRTVGELSSGRVDSGWKKGTVFDYNDASLHEAIQKGFISQNEADYVKANRPIINIGRSTGLNANAAARNVYSDFSKPYSDPVMNTFSNWVFNKVYSGTMNEMFVSEWKGRRSKYPELNDAQFGRMLSKEVNTIWGQRGKSGFIKSRTAQDLSQIFFLAPRWVEGLVTREAGAIKNIAYSMPKDFLGGKGYRPNLMAKAIAGGVAGFFAANQAINFATRGKPTWENEEKGHKLDAYLPNAVGGEGEGLWLSPFAPTAEITHDIFRYSQIKGSDDNLGALAQIVSNKLSPISRAGMVFTTGRDYQGNILKDYDRLKAMGYALAPIPIMATSITRDMDLGMAGQNLERQLIATAGIKTEPVNPNSPRTSAEEEILAKVKDKGYYSSPDETQKNRLKNQLRFKIGKGKATPQEIRDGIDAGIISPESLSTESKLEDLSIPYYQRLFKRLGLEDAKEIYSNMPDEEKKKYVYILSKKFSNKSALERFLLEEAKKRDVIELSSGHI